MIKIKMRENNKVIKNNVSCFFTLNSFFVFSFFGVLGASWANIERALFPSLLLVMSVGCDLPSNVSPSFSSIAFPLGCSLG